MPVNDFHLKLQPNNIRQRFLLFHRFLSIPNNNNNNNNNKVDRLKRKLTFHSYNNY
jgi:hypothetical protein